MREHLELFFRGERDYLQGSLILSQAVAAFSRTLGPDEARPVAVVQASFRSITARHCLAVDEKPPRNAPSVASVRVRLEDGGARTLWVIEDLARAETPSRVADAPGLLRACVGKPDLSAKASLEPIESFDALVSGLIQVIRSALFDFRPGARNVWLLSLTDMALPLDTSPFVNGAEVTLTLEGTRRRGDRNVIIEQIVLEGAGAPPVTLRMMCSWEGDFEGS